MPWKDKKKNAASAKRWRKANSEYVKLFDIERLQITPGRKEAIKKSGKRWYEAHSEARIKQCMEYARLPERKLARKEARKQLKKECFTAYNRGRPPVCVCCGEAMLNFLTLDHIFNDGFKDRKREGKTTGILQYEKLKRQGYPNKERFQVLCYNCNCGKGTNGGVCPHKQR